MSKAEITQVRKADENHQVVTVEGGHKGYKKRPCADCPWRKDAVGVFPAEAFRLSAHTSYDMNDRTFGCHSAGSEKPKTCAGFLLKGARHNLAVRLRAGVTGDYDLNAVSDGGHELFESYKAMAIANGVSPDDECLKQSRED